jgi:hypothetical protein
MDIPRLFLSLVAVQCLETSFNVSLANPPNGPAADLLSLVANTPTTNLPSWLNATNQSVMIL